MRVSPISTVAIPLVASEYTFDGNSSETPLIRDPSALSAKDVKFNKILKNSDEVEEQTLMQVEIINKDLARKELSSELASKNTCLTRRWQTALVTTSVLLALGIGIGK